MLVKDVMTSSPAVAVPSDSVAAVAQLMKTHGIGLVPIVESKLYRRLLGVVTDRDLVVRCLADTRSDDDPIGEFMTPTPIATTSPLDDITAAQRVMRASNVRRVPVVDEDEIVLGIVSRVDVERSMAADVPVLAPTMAE